MSDSPDKVLTYAPRQKFHLSRRAKQITLIIVALVITAILAPQAYRQLHRKWVISKFANYVMRSDIPMIEVEYKGEFGTWKDFPPLPNEFDDILDVAGPTVFIGSLRTKAGDRRLVRIGFRSQKYHPKELMYLSRTMNIDADPSVESSRNWPIQTDTESKTPPTGMKIFGGLRDPSDPSHITIRFVRDDSEGLLDGWLNDDGTMTLELRDTPATNPSN